MFKISPVQNKALQKEYAEACGTKFCPELFAFSMINQENGELMGFSQFDLIDGMGYIKDLKPRLGYSDFEAMFILGRATLNFIDLCDVHTCRAALDAGEERLMCGIGFKLVEGEYFATLTGMFDGNCSSHK